MSKSDLINCKSAAVMLKSGWTCLSFTALLSSTNSSPGECASDSDLYLLKYVTCQIGVIEQLHVKERNTDVAEIMV